MAVLYTKEEIQRVLVELRIQPTKNGVSSAEAARILTWRAKQECKIDHEYTQSAVRRHIHLGNLTPWPQSTRFNRYRIEDIFLLSLVPKRGLDHRRAA
ncbi:MAG: hypothetical protein ACRDHZ_00740 [Ktedonobacteraceae bacterium]